jgi:hypothetical protein
MPIHLHHPQMKMKTNDSKLMADPSSSSSNEDEKHDSTLVPVHLHHSLYAYNQSAPLPNPPHGWKALD